MKNTFLSATALVALSASAFAADLPSRTASPAPVFVVSTWAGPYVGVSLGGSATKNTWTTTSVPDPSNEIATAGDAPGDYANPASLNKTSVRGAIFAGYNFLVAPSVVAGLEAEGGYAFGGKKSVYGIPGTFVGAYPVGQPDSASGNLTWDGSLRARLGYLVTPDALVYGTAGVAFTNAKYNVSCIDGPGWCDADANENQSQVRVGWTIGAGFEYKLATNLAARLEYRYSDFGKKSATWLPQTSTDTLVASTRLSTQSVMVGLAYQLGGY